MSGVIICHFNTVNTLDMVESGYSRTWWVSVIRWSPWIICIPLPKPRWCVVKIDANGQYLGYARVRAFADFTRVSVLWWSPGIICTLCRLAKAKMGGVVKIEGTFYEWTTTPECSVDRTDVVSAVKTESELCVYIRVSTLHTHTFEGLQSWVTKPTNTEYTTVIWENFFSLSCKP